MIIAKNFSLGHIPRTAGTKTAVLINNFSKVLDVEFITRPGRHQKHFNFFYWKCQNKNLILNFRRLIPWMRSIIDFYEKIGVWPERKRVKLKNINQITDLSLRWGIDYNKEFNVPLALLPDTYINYFTSGLVISNWIRCEYLNKDIINKLIKPYMNQSIVESLNLIVGNAEIERLVEVISKKSNKGTYIAEYDRNLYNYFTLDDMKKIYENNPLWASIEKKQYGNLFYQITK